MKEQIEQIKHIIIDSDSKLVFVEDSIQLEKIKSIIEYCPKIAKGIDKLTNWIK